MTRATTTPNSARGSTRAATITWIVLCVLTIGTWWLSPAHSGVAAVASVSISVAVVALGFIKGRLIIRYFMEARTAPRWLRLATDGWLLVLWTAVLVIYLV